MRRQLIKNYVEIWTFEAGRGCSVLEYCREFSQCWLTVNTLQGGGILIWKLKYLLVIFYYIVLSKSLMTCQDKAWDFKDLEKRKEQSGRGWVQVPGGACLLSTVINGNLMWLWGNTAIWLLGCIFVPFNLMSLRQNAHPSHCLKPPILSCRLLFMRLCIFLMSAFEWFLLSYKNSILAKCNQGIVLGHPFT